MWNCAVACCTGYRAAGYLVKRSLSSEIALSVFCIYVMLIAVKILVAGVGNCLRSDDGFGVAAAQQLLAEPMPAELRVVEVGIGGIHLIQELFDRPDVLVVLDAVDLGKRPGTVLVMRPEVADIESLSLEARHDQLADMHWASPSRAFMLARALGILPEDTWIVGCQPQNAEMLGEGLSECVSGAVKPAIQELRALVQGMGVVWP